MTKLDHLAMRLVIATTLLVPTCLPAFAQEAANLAQDRDVFRAVADEARSDIDEIKGKVANGYEALRAFDAFSEALSHAQASTEDFRQICARHQESMLRVDEALRPQLEPQTRHCRAGLVRLEQVLATALKRMEEVRVETRKIRTFVDSLKTSLDVEGGRAKAFSDVDLLIGSMNNAKKETDDVFRPGS